MSSEAKRTSRIGLLFDKYRADLRRFLGASLHDKNDVDDLIQETFLNVWKQESQGRLEGDLRGYLFTTARNLAFNRWRYNRARRTDKHVRLSEEVDAVCSIDYEKLLFEREGIRILEKALANLAPQTRTIFLMHHVEGAGSDEIARQLCISTRTVERHMARALKHCHAAAGPLLTDLLG
jgi:RNA polymerase sigma factor (sigma-70 family)